MKQSTENLVCVGKITSVHGVRGQVKIQSFTENPKDITAYGAPVDKKGKPYNIKVTGAKKEAVIASIEGVTDRNEAELLRGKELFVPRESMPQPSDNEFYIEDMIGLPVTNEQGTALGAVKAIHNFGAGDILEVTKPDGKAIMYPFDQDTIIDVSDKAVILQEPEVK